MTTDHAQEGTVSAYTHPSDAKPGDRLAPGDYVTTRLVPSMDVGTRVSIGGTIGAAFVDGVVSRDGMVCVRMPTRRWGAAVPVDALTPVVEHDDAQRAVPDTVSAADVWDEGFEAGSGWAVNNPGPSGTPHDPPPNPYTDALPTVALTEAEKDVEWLGEAMRRGCGACASGWENLPPAARESWMKNARGTIAALLSPPPPPVTEPTGRWAVVADDDGREWRRALRDRENPWMHVDEWEGVVWGSWDDFSVSTPGQVLSDGAPA